MAMKLQFHLKPDEFCPGDHLLAFCNGLRLFWNSRGKTATLIGSADFPEFFTEC